MQTQRRLQLGLEEDIPAEDITAEDGVVADVVARKTWKSKTQKKQWTVSVMKVRGDSRPGGGGGVLIYFSLRERVAEQGIIFRIPNP